MIHSFYHLALLINATTEFLRSTPEIKLRMHKANGKVYQTYVYRDPATKKTHQYDSSTVKGKKLQHIFEIRQKAENKLAHYQNMWHERYSCSCPKLNLGALRGKGRSAFITKEVYDRLVPRSNPHEITTPHEHNGTFFRSKSEREMAEYLDEMGIEYKYEPLMQFGDITIYPDFVCYIPELGFGFIIEHFGLVDSPSYAENAMKKIKLYIEAGLVPGFDILFTFEKGKCPPRGNYFACQINSVLDNLCLP